MPDIRMRGTISSCGFTSGDRLVVGAWNTSPLGAFADVMWAAPDGTRTLLAPTDKVASFVTSIYAFDQVNVVPFSVATATPSDLDITAGPLEIKLHARGGMRIPVARPAWFTAKVEGPIAKAVMGVQTFGASPTGTLEWYQARSWRWVSSGRAWLDDRDLGDVAPIDPPVGVGFSEPPPRPSIVDVAVRIRRPA